MGSITLQCSACGNEMEMDHKDDPTIPESVVKIVNNECPECYAASGKLVVPATQETRAVGVHPNSDDGFCGWCNAFTRNACQRAQALTCENMESAGMAFAFDPRDGEQSIEAPETWTPTSNPALIAGLHLIRMAQLTGTTVDWKSVADNADACEARVASLEPRNRK